MKYKQGKLIETYNTNKDRRVTLSKINKGYRVTLFKKKVSNVWVVESQRNAPLKKYAERRLIEYLEKFN